MFKTWFSSIKVIPWQHYLSEYLVININFPNPESQIANPNGFDPFDLVKMGFDEALGLSSMYGVLMRLVGV
jgi:hypothetical protein